MELSQKESGKEKNPGDESLSEEYRRLKAEHTLLDKKLIELENNRFPSPEGDLEIKNLKKQKLALKTRMEQLSRKG